MFCRHMKFEIKFFSVLHFLGLGCHYCHVQYMDRTECYSLDRYQQHCSSQSWKFRIAVGCVGISRCSEGENQVKCTLVQALRLCTSCTAYRGSRCIALLFLDHGTRRGWGVGVTPRPLFTPRERPDTHYRGCWVGRKAILDRCGKSRPHRDSIPGPSSS